jgi:hypothetical protein
MKVAVAALLACCGLAGVVCAAQPVEPALDLSAKPQPATPVLTDEIIRKAVRETIAEDPHPAPVANQQAGVLRVAAASMEERMSTAFEEAKVPDCLHQDALKLQPAHIGPIGVVGPLSLPWIVAAVVRGKCR